MSEAHLERYQKLGITLKAYLKGKGYNKALEAYEFARERHPGTRKDGKTPNFQHQIEICLFIMTLKEVQFEEATLMAALLHDVREDAGVADSEIRSRFGDVVADAVEKLTKEFRGAKKKMEVYFAEIAKCPIASLVKAADRVNNVSTMVGVFTIEKQREYVDEIRNFFFPMLKRARYDFPQQQLSYHAMQTFLKTMCKTVEAVLAAEEELLISKVSIKSGKGKPDICK